MAQIVRRPPSRPVGGPPQRLLSDGPANNSDEWQVVLRHREGTVVRYNPADRTLAIEKPVRPRYGSSAIVEEHDAFNGVEGEDRHNNASFNACPLCRRPFSQRQPSSSPHSQPYAFLTSDERIDEHISSDYFHLLSESLQNSPRILSPEPSRPGTPVVSNSTSRLDESAFLEGYYERFFLELESLGRGMSGSVHLCQHVLNGNKLGFYACKKIPVGNSSPSLVKALKEINNLESLRHPNIVAIHHVWLETTSVARGPPVPCLFALMDYANDGSLDRYIRHRGGLQDGACEEAISPEELKAQTRQKRKAGSPSGASRPVHLFSLEEILSLSNDITAGLAFLHSHNMLHLDLKAENILLNRNENEDTLIPRALLSDFGSSEARNAMNRKHRSGTTGTLDYLAPEAFDILPNGRPRQHSAELDLWALGLLLHLLAFFQLPYRATEIDGLTSEIKRYQGYNRSTSAHSRRDIAPEYFTLLEALINVAPSCRPPAAEVLRQLQTMCANRGQADKLESMPRRMSSALVSLSKHGKIVDNRIHPKESKALQPLIAPQPTLSARNQFRHFGLFAARAAILCYYPGYATSTLPTHSISFYSLMLILAITALEMHRGLSILISIIVSGLLLAVVKVYPIVLGVC